MLKPQNPIIPFKAFESPALKRQDKKYPARYGGKVPLTIRMTRNVRGDIPITLIPIAVADNEYYCWVNSYGAVAIITNNGDTLGVKPDEFEVVAYHNEIEPDKATTIKLHIDVSNTKLREIVEIVEVLKRLVK